METKLIELGGSIKRQRGEKERMGERRETFDENSFSLLLLHHKWTHTIIISVADQECIYFVNKIISD